MTSANNPQHLDILQDAQHRAGVYHLLARLWIQEIDRDLLDQLQHDAFGQAYRAAGGSLPPLKVSEQFIEDLQLDYCRLFLGPQGHKPPVQSIWQEGHFEGAAAAALARTVNDLGLESALNASLPHDHIGNILALYGSLLAAMETHQPPPDAELCNLAVALFREHLTWIPEFAQAAAQRCETEFYRGCLSVTQRFLTLESSLLLTTPLAS